MTITTRRDIGGACLHNAPPFATMCRSRVQHRPSKVVFVAWSFNPKGRPRHHVVGQGIAPFRQENRSKLLWVAEQHLLLFRAEFLEDRVHCWAGHACLFCHAVKQIEDRIMRVQSLRRLLLWPLTVFTLELQWSQSFKRAVVEDHPRVVIGYDDLPNGKSVP